MPPTYNRHWKSIKTQVGRYVVFFLYRPHHTNASCKYAVHCTNSAAAARGIPHMQYLNKKLTLMLLALKIQQLDHHYGLGSTHTMCLLYTWLVYIYTLLVLRHHHCVCVKRPFLQFVLTKQEDWLFFTLFVKTSVAL